jgi:TusA-related sulfurtransferase
VLRVVPAGPGAVKDFRTFCKQTGNELLAQTQAGNEYTFFSAAKVKRAAAATGAN